MGQAIRAMKYDRTANECNAIPGLTFHGRQLQWHRLDDGVMGGKSETVHSCSTSDDLIFAGQINTDGGGFCSIRTPLIPGELTRDTVAVRVCYIGDGKTYKILFSDKNKSAFGPSRRSPSWQMDLPTKSGVEETINIRFDELVPSLQGGPMKNINDDNNHTEIKIDPTTVEEMGFMLSLKLSNGSSNPVETFGSGIFPFSLTIRSIDIVSASDLN